MKLIAFASALSVVLLQIGGKKNELIHPQAATYLDVNLKLKA